MVVFIFSGNPGCGQVHPVHREEDDVLRLRHREDERVDMNNQFIE